MHKRLSKMSLMQKRWRQSWNRYYLAVRGSKFSYCGHRRSRVVEKRFKIYPEATLGTQEVQKARAYAGTNSTSVKKILDLSRMRTTRRKSSVKNRTLFFRKKIQNGKSNTEIKEKNIVLRQIIDWSDT